MAARRKCVVGRGGRRCTSVHMGRCVTLLRYWRRARPPLYIASRPLMIKSVEVPAAEPGGELLALVAERNELVRLRTRNKIGIVVQTTIDAASSGGAITLIKEWSDIKAASTILLSELDDMFPEPMIALSFSRRILACRSVQS